MLPMLDRSILPSAVLLFLSVLLAACEPEPEFRVVTYEEIVAGPDPTWEYRPADSSWVEVPVILDGDTLTFAGEWRYDCSLKIERRAPAGVRSLLWSLTIVLPKASSEATCRGRVVGDSTAFQISDMFLFVIESDQIFGGFNPVAMPAEPIVFHARRDPSGVAYVEGAMDLVFKNQNAGGNSHPWEDMYPPDTFRLQIPHFRIHDTSLFD